VGAYGSVDGSIQKLSAHMWTTSFKMRLPMRFFRLALMTTSTFTVVSYNHKK
jgi:hypothetical protein